MSRVFQCDGCETVESKHDFWSQKDGDVTFSPDQAGEPDRNLELCRRCKKSFLDWWAARRNQPKCVEASK